MTPHLFSRPDQVNDTLYVLTPLYNPARFRARWRLHQDWAERVRHSGAELYEVEIAFGDRDFAMLCGDVSRLEGRQGKVPRHSAWALYRAV